MSAGDDRRVCLFVGAGGPLATAFLRAYAADYYVVAAYRSRTPAVVSQLETLVDPLAPNEPNPRNDHPVYLVQSALDSQAEVARVVDVALARHERIDLVVNNAAYSRFQPNGLTDVDGVLADFDEHMAVNVRLPMQVAGEVARRYWMHRTDNREHNRNVVNVSSTSGSRVYPGGQAVYASAKAALNHLTRYLAHDFTPFGVRVNAVAPNSFPTTVRTDEVARAVRRLDTADVTGRILVVDPPAPG